MSSFTGVSVADGNNMCFCDTSAVDARGDSGYHLLMVKGYSRTKELLSMGESIAAGPFVVGGHHWLIEYYPSGRSPRIGVSSVASTLALAEQHRCRGLKEACLKFIQAQSPSRLQTVMATDGWDHVHTTYPSVLNEFIAKLIASTHK